MCVSATMLLAVATGVQALGSISEGRQEKKKGEFLQQQSYADAQAEREAGQVRANKIREQGRLQKSNARASLAKSGVAADAGSALQIQGDITRRVESDAIAEIMGAGYSSVKRQQQGDLDKLAGDNAYTAGILGAGKSLLSGGYEYGKSKQTTQPGWIGQQPKP